MTYDTALATCSLVYPAALDGAVEIAVAEPANRVFPARVSPGLGICVKVGSSHEVTINGRRATYPADSVALRAPGCVWSSLDGTNGFVSIDIAPDWLPEPGISGAMGFVGRRGFPDVAAVARRLATAESTIEADEILSDLVARAVSSGVVQSDALRDPGGVRGAVDDARDFLAANLAGRPTLDAAADAAGVSKFTLLRRFRRVVGTTPHAYLVMLRIARARELLADGAPPAQVALEAGFSDQAHLGRWFRRAMGLTPAAYARRSRRGPPASISL
jgi:AraC-like DNA-binding protein